MNDPVQSIYRAKRSHSVCFIFLSPQPFSVHDFAKLFSMIDYGFISVRDFVMLIFLQFDRWLNRLIWPYFRQCVHNRCAGMPKMRDKDYSKYETIMLVNDDYCIFSPNLVGVGKKDMTRM